MVQVTAFDVFVIGGGINGASIARDAVGRGYRVALAEMGDLAGATSSKATKLIHGGLRYLEYYEFRLVREASTNCVLFCHFTMADKDLLGCCGLGFSSMII